MSGLKQHIHHAKSWYIGLCFVAVVIVGSSIFVHLQKRSTPLRFAPPTQAPGQMRDAFERHRFKQQREEYIERRHGNAPGVDWRQMDLETRRQIREERQALIKEMKQQPLSPHDSVIETIAITRASAEGDAIPTMSTSDVVLDSLCGRWVERGSNNQAGRMHTADVSQDGTIFAASAGGIIWTGSRAGNDWQSLNDHFAFNDVSMINVLATQKGDRIIVLDADGCHRSDDNGLTWESIGSWNELVGGRVLDRDKSVYVVAKNWNHQADQNELFVYRSTDLGETLRPIFSVLGDPLAAVCAPGASGGAAMIYLLVDQQMYRLDAEDTVVKLGSLPLPEGSMIIGNEFHPSLLAGGEADGELSLYASLNVGVPITDGGWKVGTSFFASFDGGFTWEYRSFLEAEAFGKNSLTCSKIDPSQVYFGTDLEIMFRSEDSATNWMTPDYSWQDYYRDYEKKLHCDIPGINVFNDGSGEHEYLLIHTDGGTYISDDGGRTVRNLSLANLRCSQYYSTFSHHRDPTIVYAGSQDQGFQRTETSQPSQLWQFNQLLSGDDGNIVSSDGGETLWWVYPGLLYYMTDAPTSNNHRLVNYSDIAGDALWLPPLMADPDDPDRVFLGGGSITPGELRAGLFWFRYNEGFIDWGTVPYDFGGVIIALAFSPIDTDYRYVMTNSAQFFFSSDKGQNWTKSVNGKFSQALFGASIVACPRTLGRVYMAGSGYGWDSPVSVSDDHGMTFEPFRSGMPNTLVNKLAISPDGELLFAATEVGPFVRAIEGGVWQYMGGVRGPDQAYNWVEYLEAIDTVRFATYGRGIWDFEITDCPTQWRRGHGRSRTP